MRSHVRFISTVHVLSLMHGGYNIQLLTSVKVAMECYLIFNFILNPALRQQHKSSTIVVLIIIRLCYLLPASLVH